MLDQGFEPWSSARKAKMIGRTTPIERSALDRMEREYINLINLVESADSSHGLVPLTDGSSTVWVDPYSPVNAGSSSLVNARIPSSRSSVPSR